MQLAGRLSAAIDILTNIFEHHVPASRALQDWGRSHRFAGSGDRAAIGNLVYDVLRRKQSLSAYMGDDTPRSLVLAALRLNWGLTPQEIGQAAQEPRFGPGALNQAETARLATHPQPLGNLGVDGDIPDWLTASFERAFGDHATAEAAALAQRAPLDLRVNTLKTNRENVLKALAKFKAEACRYSPIGIRIHAKDHSGRLPNVEADPAHGKGWFEVQDQSSQLAALLSNVQPEDQVIDLCAGAGGKTLAMSAMMQNKGQIHAYDADKYRLRPIFERIKRAGSRNIQIIGADEPQRLEAMRDKVDAVLVDAPCSGSGSWRRKPDAKWRLRPDGLAQRQEEQRALLCQGARLVRPGGRLIYVTCSVLPEENHDQIDGFLKGNSEFRLSSGLPQTGGLAASPVGHVQLTPAQHGGDGFFIAVLERNPR